MAAKKKITQKSEIEKSQAKKKTLDSGHREANVEFPIVGIGASAGGLEAIEGFLSHVPAESGIAFVIIQHRAPDYKSVLSSLLNRYTKMEVAEAEDQTLIRPNRIYLNPPNHDLSIMDGKLFLADPAEKRGFRLPIDHFFKSLAHDCGNKAVGVVLSGTGTDGTSGLKEIKAAGGMAMVQEESQSRYSGMPKSAIDTGLIDFVLPVEKMPAKLLQYVKHPYIHMAQKELTEDKDFETYLHKIFLLVRSKTGHDFSGYKRSTIHRRIQRRMAVHQIDNIKDYVNHLKKDAGEVKILLKDFLITVTNFFRDPDAFQALYEKVICPLVKAKSNDSSIRVWIPGCATGEEAYSVAILFAEAAKEYDKLVNIQIFATDIDDMAIEVARKSVYPDSIAADVSEERLKRFFVKTQNAYQVKKSIREMIVFAVQDLIKDPPFSRLDLLCCRNLLIYMDSALQKKVFPIFYYSLNPDGCLFLGTSENIGSFSGSFRPVDIKWKIFKRKGPAAETNFGGRSFVPSYENRANGKLKESLPSVPQKVDVRDVVEKTMMASYAPPCVLINRDFDVLYFHGATDKFLTMPQGIPNFNILEIARSDLRYKLSSLLHKAMTDKKTTEGKNIKVRVNDQVVNLKIIVKPVSEPSIKDSFLMVIFEASPLKTQQAEKENKPGSPDPRIEALEQELASAREYLHSTIEEQETSNEELKSSNEELQSTNEELQSTNEELETSREELQSTNEELETVNSELREKLDELFVANNNLSNLMSSTDIAIIFLDNQLNIKRFTGKMKDYFKLIPSDIGRPISDIAHNLEYNSLEEDSRDVIDNLNKIEKEIHTKDKKWLSLKIVPFRTAENTIQGAVLSFFDITAQKKNTIIAAARDFAESIVETVRQPLIVIDSGFKVISANRSFYETFKVKPAGTESTLIYELGNRQWDIPKLRKLLDEVLTENKDFNDFEVEHDFPEIGKKKMLLNARRIFKGDLATETILLAIEDITE